MTRRILITPGEPAGVGPELCVQLAQSAADVPPLADTELVVLTDPEMMQARAAQIGLPLKLRQCRPDARPVATDQGELAIIPINLSGTATPGQPDTGNARAILQALDQAVDLCRQGKAAAMVTGPVQKSVISDAGIPFSGHTEYLAERCSTPRTVMMLATEGLRVALATTHIPLRHVADHITPDLLSSVLDILHHDLQHRFHISSPRITVCGLNPHAGEGGHLGREEIDIIIPLLEQKRQQGMFIRGPLPADTLFTHRILSETDAVLAMYHDQGLPVLKHMGFGKAVNITLGLPIVRTSVDHGTALDLAGTGKADAGSLYHAVLVALQMAGHS